MSETLTADRPHLETRVTSRPAEGPAGSYGFARSMVSMTAMADPQAEAIRALRTHLIAQHINHGRRALAVCGPSVGVGCSFIATNLAISLSQIGVRTLLIDGNLRDPTIDSLIRPPHAPLGLAHCLEQPDAPFNACIDAHVLPNLSVLYAGQARADAQELLSGDRFRSLMNYCLREYDATIVDTPAANTFSDARRITLAAGYALIVTAKDKTAVRDVKVLTSQIKTDRALVIGTVLNRA